MPFRTTGKSAEGDVITLDGNIGAVYAGKLDVVEEKPTELIETVRRWHAV